MDFSREREVDFQEADRRYAELKRQLDAGTISTEEFDAQRRRLMVQDDEGRWWAKSRGTGEWNYHDGSAWVRGTPPGYQPPPTLPAESTPDRQYQLEQDERLPASQTTLPGSAPVEDQNRGKPHRRVLPGAIIALGLAGMALVGVVIINWFLVPYVTPYFQPKIEGASSQEGQKPAPGYDLATDASGKLSVEVPDKWKERISTNPEGEKGKGWDSFAGESVIGMTAANDLHSWRTGSKGHQGMYIAASKKLAQSYTDDELVTSGPHDYSSSCEAGARRDFDRPPYSGKIQEWNNCGGIAGHTALTLAASPEGRECVVLLLIGGYLQGEEESVQHILDTFEVDCRGVD